MYKLTVVTFIFYTIIVLPLYLLFSAALNQYSDNLDKMSEMSQHLAKESSEYNVPINALKNPYSNSTTRLSLPLRTRQGTVYMSEIHSNCNNDN